MFEKKKLILNCDVCDTRKIKLEDYSHYEYMQLNCDLLLVNAESKSILSQLPITCNVDTTLELPDDQNVSVQSINGSLEIGPNSLVQPNTLLVLNGSLNLLPGADLVMDNYIKICLNGSIRCPKSAEYCLSKIALNGHAAIYPDDCVLLDPTFRPDKYFALRAKKDTRYYAAKKIILNDPDIDLIRLADKNVQFVTKTLVVTESLLEDAIPLFDETVNFVVAPAGYALICGDVTLDKTLLTQNCGKLFIYGDLTLTDDSIALCSQIEKLIVKGTVHLTTTQLEAFKTVSAQYDALDVVKGRIFKNKPALTLDNTIFEKSRDGILVLNTAMVTLAENISVETILEKLELKNCAVVNCSPEQAGAVSAVGTNVATVNSGNNPAEDNAGIFGGMDIKNMFKTATDTKVVNADTYVM